MGQTFHPRRLLSLPCCGVRWRSAAVYRSLERTKTAPKKTMAAPERQTAGLGEAGAIVGTLAGRRVARGTPYRPWSGNLADKTPPRGRDRPAREGRSAYRGQWLPCFQAAPRRQNRMATQLNASDMEMPSVNVAWRKDVQRSAIRGQVEEVVVVAQPVRIKRLKSIAVWDLVEVSDSRKAGDKDGRGKCVVRSMRRQNGRRQLRGEQ